MAVGTRILSVEDDERIRTAVKLALEDEGWSVEEADTGEEALNRSSASPPTWCSSTSCSRASTASSCAARGGGSAAQLRRSDRDGDGTGRHPRRGGGAGGGRRRLPHQAVRPEGAVGPHPGAAAPGPRHPTPPPPTSVFGDLEIVPDEGVVRRGGEEIHLTKTEFRLLVELAEPRPSVQPRGAARAGVGLRLLRGRPPGRRPRAQAAHEGRGRSRQPAPRRHGAVVMGYQLQA